MAPGKFKLNPNATPFVPTTMRYWDSHTELAGSEHEAAEGSAEYKLPKTLLDYDIPIKAAEGSVECKLPENLFDYDIPREAANVSAEYKPQDTLLDYDIPGFDELHVSGQSSSNPNQEYSEDNFHLFEFEKQGRKADSRMPPETILSKFSDNTFDDDLVELDKQSRKADSSMPLETLLSMFPDIAVDFLVELLYANNGDLTETIDMMQQLEDDSQ